MWNFDAKKMIDEFKKEMEGLQTWKGELTKRICFLEQEMVKLNNVTTPSQMMENRLKEMELWQSKLHSLMIEKTPSGTKEKLTRNYSFLRGKI